MSTLTKKDFVDAVSKNISTQVYSPKPQIAGVQIKELRQFVGEDGSFEELMRLNTDGKPQLFPDFQLRQVSYSRLLPKAVKAWHIHFKMEDIWYVPPQEHMLLGLWDVRKDSKTKDIKMRITMGAGISKLVYIPPGVAHGVLNLGNTTGSIVYFLSEQFDPSNPDEHRLPWDAAGENFWQPERG